MSRLKVLPRLALATALLIGPLAAPAAAEVSISGEGSSFVLIEVDQWRADVSKFNPPLVVNYIGSSSGIGRQRFLDPPASRTVDFAISDIPYVTEGPSSPFAYVPISAGGMAFMFNLKDKAGRRIKDLRLTPETACKIFTNQITKWSDPLLVADNPKLRAGVSQDKIKLVLRNGAAGTSYILGQYCIATAPAVWNQFQNDAPTFPGAPASGYEGAPGPPVNQWPVPLGGVNAGNSDGNADQVANEATGESSICVVETGFAKNRKFPVASVKNAAGVFIQPTDSAVTKALGYAGSDPRGTQKLDFVTPDANAYNPSTYSYALVPINTGLDPAKGTVLAKFLNYAVGAGQESAEVLGYAPLPQNLVDLAFDLIRQIPGAPPKESYTAVQPKAPPVAEEETPDPGTDPGNGGGGGGGVVIGGVGGDGGGGQTPAAGDGGGGGQTPAAGSDGGNASGSGNSGSASGSGGGGSGAGSDSGSTSGVGGATSGSGTPGAAGGSTTTVATVKGNTVTNGKTTVAGKTGSPANAGGGSNQVAAGAFVEQASERPVDPDSSVPLAWVLALGAAGYLFARRGRKSVST
jgi:phosphate transport system substrate-binding protein